MNPLASDDIKNIEAALKKMAETLKGKEDQISKPGSGPSPALSRRAKYGPSRSVAVYRSCRIAAGFWKTGHRPARQTFALRNRRSLVRVQSGALQEAPLAVTFPDPRL